MLSVMATGRWQQQRKMADDSATPNKLTLPPTLTHRTHKAPQDDFLLAVSVSALPFPLASVCVCVCLKISRIKANRGAAHVLIPSPKSFL